MPAFAPDIMTDVPPGASQGPRTSSTRITFLEGLKQHVMDGRKTLSLRGVKKEEHENGVVGKWWRNLLREMEAGRCVFRACTGWANTTQFGWILVSKIGPVNTIKCLLDTHTLAPLGYAEGDGTNTEYVAAHYGGDDGALARAVSFTFFPYPRFADYGSTKALLKQAIDGRHKNTGSVHHRSATIYATAEELVDPARVSLLDGQGSGHRAGKYSVPSNGGGPTTINITMPSAPPGQSMPPVQNGTNAMDQLIALYASNAKNADSREASTQKAATDREALMIKKAEKKEDQTLNERLAREAREAASQEADKQRQFFLALLTNKDIPADVKMSFMQGSGASMLLPPQGTPPTPGGQALLKNKED
jgi:hypothetical protein